MLRFRPETETAVVVGSGRGEARKRWGLGGGGRKGEEESGRLPRPKTSSGQPTRLAVLSESR